MNNLEHDLANLQERYRTEEEALRTRYAVRELLPDTAPYAPPFVCVHRLYDTACSVSYQIQRYASIAKGESPDAKLLRSLLEALPPLSCVLVSDGCKSFRIPGDWKGEQIPVWGIQIRILEDAAEVRWVASLLNGSRARMSVEMPRHRAASLRCTERRDFNKRLIARDWSIYPQGILKTANTIRWASGDRMNERPNDFTLWWPEGSEPADLPAIWE